MQKHQEMFSDPAFTENRGKPIHRWVPWIAGFSGDFVADVIKKYELQPKEGNIVFDPFAGVGTTLVQAKIEGFDTQGAEINPYATMVCRVKLKWEIDLGNFKNEISKLKSYVKEIESGRKKIEPVIRPPSGFKTREPFFDPLTEKKVLLLKEFVLQVPEDLRDFFKVAFGAILVKHSKYAYGPSLGRKSVMGIRQSENAQVGVTFLQKVEEIYQDLEWLHKSVIPKLPKKPTHKIFDKSVFKCLDEIPEDSIALIVTSPPYLNNYHYPRNTRPQLYWLDLIEKPKDLDNIEWESFGKFWQTVRELPTIDLTFVLPELEKVIEKIRERNPQKGIYGGGGWANYASTYFNDVNKLFELIYPKVKKNSIMVWVLGNSILQGVEVKTEEFVAKIACLQGFECEGIYRIRKKRIGSSIVNTSVRTKPTKPTELYEAAVILSKK